MTRLYDPPIFIVSKGSFTEGFDFFGPFPSQTSAEAFYRLHEGSEIIPLRRYYDGLTSEGPSVEGTA